jgi:hypothetical protein
MRTLTIDEYCHVSGGDCGAGGDCGDPGDSGDCPPGTIGVPSSDGSGITCAGSVSADGTATVTISGMANPNQAAIDATINSVIFAGVAGGAAIGILWGAATLAGIALTISLPAAIVLGGLAAAITALIAIVQANAAITSAGGSGGFSDGP